MQADVWASRLPPLANRELMTIRGKIAESVQSSRRSMGHNPIFGGTPPSRNIGGELEPGGPQREVVRNGRPRETVDAVGHAL
jgi:hypothetical protein